MPLTLPLSQWAQERLDELAALVRCPPFPSANDLMRERARINRLRIPGRVSAGGGCRFYETSDGWVALNLARAADRELLPALFSTEEPGDPGKAFWTLGERQAVARGRILGLALAGLSEEAGFPALEIVCHGSRATPRPAPVVVDLSALWAGPLASRLLRLTGCRVTRIESLGREDPLRHSDPEHFAMLDSGKKTVALDLRTSQGLDRLHRLIDAADIVIEAARPRALLQLGIDANAIVRSKPGLVWMTITGHGGAGEAAEWVAFGDDAAVSGGLSRELWDATGQIGFVGDAIADPLAGIAAAGYAMRQYRGGHGARMVLSMSGTVREAIAAEKQRDPAAWRECLQAWAAQTGRTFDVCDVLREGHAAC